MVTLVIRPHSHDIHNYDGGFPVQPVQWNWLSMHDIPCQLRPYHGDNSIDVGLALAVPNFFGRVIAFSHVSLDSVQQAGDPKVLTELKANLKVLHNVRDERSKAVVSQQFVNDYLSTSFTSGTSVEHLQEQLQKLCNDDLITPSYTLHPAQLKLLPTP